MELNHLYFVEREFDCEIDALWSAWTNASELERWYSPTMLSVVPGSVTSEVEVGGRWAIAVDVSINGFNAYFWGRYSEVIKNERLVHSMSYSQDQAEFVFADENAPAHRVELDFGIRGDKAWVRFTQFGELPSEQIEATRDGMDSYFDNLEQYLENK
jgi:uncharacterized protein YndB with AHSA1/START domain